MYSDGEKHVRNKNQKKAKHFHLILLSECLLKTKIFVAGCLAFVDEFTFIR